MPNVVLPNPDVQSDDVARFLKQRFAGKYEVASSRARNVDFDVFPSPWKGAAVRVRSSENQTVIKVFGNVPNTWARVASTIVVIFPSLYLMLVAARPVVNDVVEALQNAPELSAGEAGGGQPPPPSRRSG